MATKGKKRFSKYDFSDEEIYNNIKDDIRDIKDMNLKQVDEEFRIMNLYEEKKKQKKKTERLKSEVLKTRVMDSKMNKKSQHDLGEDDEQEGEIYDNEKPIPFDKNNEEGFEGMPSISDLGDFIRPITLTRNTICDLLNSRKFQDIVKGCFARYKCQNTSTNPPYLLAQIIGVVEGSKQYSINNHKTKLLLKLQQTSQQVVTLAIELLSNKHPPGGLQISKWLQTNRNKIPKQNVLKEKLKQLTTLITGRVTSQEIDANILNEARKTADGKQEVKGDIDRLINFMSNNIHNISVQLDEVDDKASDVIKNKTGKKKQFEQILSKLQILKQEYIQEQRQRKEQQKRKREVNKYSEVMFNSRKEDRINEHFKQKLSSFASYEGTMKYINQITQSHKTFNVNIDL